MLSSLTMTRFKEAQQRLATALARQRACGAARNTQDAAASVWPLLPTLIDERIGDAHARILTRDALRELLADFAVDMLIEQACAVERWTESHELRRKTRKGT